MPHGNKVARSNNKKKKGKTANHSNNGGGQPSTTAAPAPAPARAPQRSMAARSKTKTPTVFSQAVLDEANWSDFINQHLNQQQQQQQQQQDASTPLSSSDQNLAQGYQSIYVRYKDATKRFKESLRSMVPQHIFHGDFVHCLLDAVDYLYDNNMKNFPDSLIQDLKLAIRVRKRVAKHHYEGGDDGHAYFLSVLLYCFAVLRQLKPLVKRARTNGRPTTGRTFVLPGTDPTENRFSLLSMEEDENDEEEDLPSGRAIKPVAPDQSSPITLAELVSGSDREAAVLFLLTLNEIMGFNSSQYSALKQNWARNKREDYPPSVIIEDILEASTAANFGIQYVQFLEQKLTTDYPHMNTIYRLMSVLVLPELTETLTKEVMEQSPRGAEFKVTDAQMFLGDCLEKCIRNDSDPVMNNVTADFSKKWQMARNTVEYYVEGLRALVAVELPVGNAREKNRSFLEHLQRAGGEARECSWLPLFDFIGMADRSILMTTRLLQGFSNVIQERQGHLISRKGFFGKSWDETPRGMAKRIVQDMDELLMGEILPVLINVCYGGLLHQKLPHEDELLPFFALLRGYVKDPKQPVSWALVFAVHTLVTSIFEVQGTNNAVHDIAEEAESCFNLYFEQISIASDAMKGGSQPKHWAENMRRLEILKMLVAPPTLKPSREQTLRAFWNPFCAGNFLGYIAYFSNLEEGSWMVDCFAQLRMVLHLYNALKDVGLAPGRKNGMLELLDANFQHSKAVWEGPKPTRGNFVQRWWIAFGMDANEARRMSDEAATRFSKARGPSNQVTPRRRLQETARRMTPIEPAKLSKSFRRIMMRDFTDVVDKYHTTAKQKSSPVYDHAVRCNDTLDAISDDQKYLAMNMTALGAHLNFFIDGFFDHYWKEQVQMIVQTTPDSVRFGRRADGRRVGRQSWETSDANLERLGMVYIFAEEILARLDFLDLSEPDPVIVQAMAAMTYFFDRLPPYYIMYFTPIQEEEEEDEIHL